MVAADVGDTLRASVTDQNLAGSKSATSLPTAIVTYGPPVPIGFPAISGPACAKAARYEASTGRWVGAGPIEYAYAWEACNAEGGCTHASGATYVLGAGTGGDTVKLVVSAHNKLGTASASSVASPTVLGEDERFAVGWGENARGQLGTVFSSGWEESPVAAEGESNIAAIATGGSFTLELHGDGTVTAAGAGYYGSIGYGGTQSELGTGQEPRHGQRAPRSQGDLLRGRVQPRPAQQRERRGVGQQRLRHARQRHGRVRKRNRRKPARAERSPRAERRRA